MKKILLFLLLICLLSNCASPKLTNWDEGNYDYYDNAGKLYKRNLHEPTNDDPKPLNHPVINVSVAAVPLPKQVKGKIETRRFIDFSEKVQLAIIKKLTDNEATNKLLINALKADYSEPEKVTPSTIKDYTDIKLRLYFSNVKRYFNDARLMNPNTRLAFLNTTVKIQEGSNMMFQSVDKLENEFESIDMGKLERSSDVNFNSKLSGDISAKINTENSNVDTNSNTSINEVKTYDEEGNELTSNTTTTTGSNNGYNDDNNTIGNSNTNSSTNGNSNSSSHNNSSSNSYSSNDGNTNTRSSKGDFGQSIKGEVALDIKNSIKEAIDVNFKRLKTGFSLNKKCLTVSQQGSLLRDVNDVTILTVSFEFNNDSKKKEDVIELNNMFNINGQPNTIKEINYSVNSITYYPCSSKEISDQKITYAFEGAIRAPKNLKRGNNILEYDDKVNYFAFDSNCYQEKDCNGKVIPKVNTLDISKFTFCKQVFRVKVINKTTGTVTYLLLALNGDKIVPHFEGKNAYEFLDWLKAIGGMKSGIYTKDALLKFFTIDTAPEKFDAANYKFELEDIDRSPGKFVITAGSNKDFLFNLSSPNGKIILSSQGHKTIASCKAAIDYIRKNASNDVFYKRINTDQNFYFNLFNGEGENIGRSEMYDSAVARENGIDSVKRNAVDALEESVN